MNLHQLKIFYNVAKGKSFSLTATKLFITQPAVSIQINLLEEYFGVKLLERKRGKKGEARLTEAGKALYSYAEQILKMASEAENVIADFRSLDHSLLNFATTRTMAKLFASNILTLLIERYPNIKINLRAGNSQEAVNWVSSFISDIALVAGVDYPNDLVAIPIFNDQLVLITSPKSRIFKKGEIEFNELHGKPIIMREKGSGTRNILLDAFKKEGILPNIIMEMGNSETTKKLVREDVGFSILTWTMVKDDIKKGFLKAIYLIDKKLTLNFHLVFHISRESSKLIQVFKDLATETFQNLAK